MFSQIWFSCYYGHRLLKVKGVKDAVTRRKKKKELTNVPEVRDNAWMSLAETFFGSGIGGHVSVWWFSSLWRSVSWNDYAGGPGVNTMTHLLFCLPSSLSSILILTHAFWELAPWFKPEFTAAWWCHTSSLSVCEVAFWLWIIPTCESTVSWL